jgi:hypothetical protein
MKKKLYFEDPTVTGENNVTKISDNPTRHFVGFVICVLSKK